MFKRSFPKISRAPFLYLFIVCLSACGPSVKISPEFKEGLIKSLAILPADYPSGVPRERIDYIRTVLSSELQNSGYAVLDDHVVSETCRDSECPERTRVIEKYPVDGFVQIAVESVSRNNFLAGYYNAIDGKLTISAASGHELFKIEHTESERGGLIFESGQIIQGIISQIKNSRDDSFNDLADKFVSTLVSKIPGNNDTPVPQPTSSSLEIKSIDMKPTGKGALEVCASATANSLASLVVNQQRSNLREIEIGRYCGIYELAALIAAPSAGIEVRSPFGDIIKKDLSLNYISPCSLEERVSMKSVPGKNQILITCTQIGDKTDTVLGGCSEAVLKCGNSRFVVYRAPSSQGPFEKIAEFNKTNWSDRSTPKLYSSPVYQVVSINELGVRSMPVSPLTSTEQE